MNEPINPHKIPYTTEQKAALVLFVLFGVGGLLLGFKSFGAMLRRPFENQLAQYEGSTFMTADQQQAKELEASKKRDTDKDGLSDYDELSVYRTSPYISDTDSDGFDDKTEVFSGNDPNCPKGKACDGSNSGEGASVQSGDTAGLKPPVDPFTTDLNNLMGISSPTSTTPTQPPTPTFKSRAEIIDSFKGLDTPTLRSILVSNGVPKAQIDPLDDATLRKLFDDTMTEAVNKGEFDSLIQSSTTP